MSVDQSILLEKNKTVFIPSYVFCADLSLRQPGFAVLELASNGRMRVLETSICKNKNKKGTHGDLLGSIANKMRSQVQIIPQGACVTFVRERAFSRFPLETQTLNKVVGVADYLLAREFSPLKWIVQPEDWQELAPKSIKAIIAGSGNATKDDVQDALKDFVGVYDFKTTDESDAVAAGVAYLIQNGFGRPLHEKNVMTRMPVGKKKRGG